MQCKICGDENRVEYRPRSGMFLCPYCHKETPAKATRDEFDHLYWGDDIETVPQSTRKEFYEDYRTSNYGPVAEYIKATTSDVL